MSIQAMILGETGTGKTASLRNLDPSITLLIQPVKKPLSFRADGWKYFDPKDGGNIISTDDADQIIACMRKTRKKIIVIDDWQYILANEFMRRNMERGYDKFNDIGRHAWDILMASNSLPDDVRVYSLAHTQTDELGHTKIKTIGRMLDEKITPEGLVTICLRTQVQDGEYRFITRNNGSDTVKTPMGLFEDHSIENDLAKVDAAICAYYNINTN